MTLKYVARYRIGSGKAIRAMMYTTDKIVDLKIVFFSQKEKNSMSKSFISLSYITLDQSRLTHGRR